MKWLVLLEYAVKLLPWFKPLLRKRARCLLIIEDYGPDAHFLESLIRNAGYKSHTVTMADSAYELIAATPKKYPIVFIDLRLPQMSGWDFVRVLQRDFPDIHCVMVPGQMYDLENLPANLYVGVIGKPVSIESVEAVIRKTRM